MGTARITPSSLALLVLACLGCSGPPGEPLDAAATDGGDAARADALTPGLDADVVPGVDASIDARLDAHVDVCARVVCSDPPPSTDFAACTPGGVFHLPLGGACGGHCDPTSAACTYDTMEVSCPAESTVLPQDEGWKVVLRNAMARYVASDFELASSARTVTYDPADARSNDQLYTLWIASQSPNGQLANLPPYGGLLLPAADFVLDRIERATPTGPELHAFVGRESSVGGRTAWYAGWADPGNPWQGDDAVLRRAFVMAAGDMMQLHTYSRTTACTRGPRSCGDDMASPLREYGSIGVSLHEQPGAVDACALAAYDVGMRTMFETWEAFDYSSPNADITMAGLPALFYIADALSDDDLRARASIDAASVMSTNCDLAGWCHHQNGTYDASYEGWTMTHVVEAALVSHDPALLEWVERMAALRSYTTLVEPDGQLVGPSHFSPATSLPAATDQADYRRYGRDVAVASIAEEGRYLAFSAAQEGTVDLPTLAEMPAAITRDLAFANDSADTVIDTQAWAIRHYPGEQGPSIRAHVPGTHALLEALRGTDAALPPILRAADYARRFEGTLVSARSSGLAAIVHFGRVDRANVASGLGGGSLSALWTRELGPVVLGWTHGSQAFTDVDISVPSCAAPLDARCQPRSCMGTPAHCTQRVDTSFTWADYRTWPVHQLVGERGASIVSSARILDPTETVTMLGGGDVEVVTSGDLSDSASAETADPDDLFAGPATLTRTFRLEGGTLTLTTALAISGAPPVLDALDEAIPLFVGARATDTITVLVRLEGATAYVPLTGPQDRVVEVHVLRGTGTLAISFDAPRRVSLGAERAGSFGWQPRTLPLYVRVGQGALPSSLELVTTFRAL